jgi:putative chitinase
MLLKIGSTGDEVKMLQTRLGITADGSFGPVTESKVKEWQASVSQAINGIIDDTCWGLLFPAGSGHIPSGVVGGLNLEALRGHIPDQVINQIPDTAVKFQITNALRLAHFLAQCGHESGNFTTVFENLNYSGDRLKVVFPKYFPGNLSDSYANNPVKIGSRVYGGRLGNGDESSGDGYHYRGRGYIQLTGKSNYAAFARFIGEDTVINPDLVATKYPLASAAFYFTSNNLWAVCDKGDGADVVTAVTKAVNGGTIGLPERIKHFNDYYSLLR